MPTANREWWEQKLLRNVERDAETNRLLAAASWTVVRVWEHEDVRIATERVLEALGD